MLVRLLVALSVVAVSLLAWVAWKRAPRRLREANLSGLLPGPAIVQFTTRYCSPCKANAPTLQRFAHEADVRYEQVDLGERPELAGEYGVRTVPTIVVIDGAGAVTATWTSLPPNGEITDAARTVAGSSRRST